MIAKAWAMAKEAEKKTLQIRSKDGSTPPVSDNSEDASSQGEPRRPLIRKSVPSTLPRTGRRPKRSSLSKLTTSATTAVGSCATGDKVEAFAESSPELLLSDDGVLKEVAAILKSQTEEAIQIRQFVVQIRKDSDETVSRLTTDTALRSQYDGLTRDRQPPFEVLVEDEELDAGNCGDLENSPKFRGNSFLPGDSANWDNSFEWGSGSFATSQPTSVLFTFQRQLEGFDKPCFATLKVNCVGDDDEETMADLVKRLQERESPVLRFNRKEKEALSNGGREVIFSLVQLSNAKFGKSEFGGMKISDILCLTHLRPILIEIGTQEVVRGVNVELF